MFFVGKALHKENHCMRSSQTLKLAATAALVVFSGSLAFALPSTTSQTGAAPARPHLTQLARVECMTDDGYGRKRPCSAGYKREHANWRGTDDCFTDDGYGRKRPCSAGYKAKYAK
jgi:hypothetical protein